MSPGQHQFSISFFSPKTETEMVKIDLMIDEVLDYKSLEEVKATLS